MIKLPLLGQLKVGGLSTSDIEGLLQKRYGEFIHNPEIAVLIREYRSQRVSVIGAVNKAGAIDLSGPKTLIDILSIAGGVNEKAGNQVHVYRQNPEGRESYVIDLFALASNVGLINDRTAEVVNLPVQGGDIINVPEAGMFFVDGAVRRPGSFPLGRRFTVTQALALAGGVNQDLADFGGITLYRTQENGIKQLSIDLNAIRNGTEPDPPMQADDSLFVPISGVKWAWDFFLRNLRLPEIIPSPLAY
jgi:polysaccharide export outer membrane protein